jgi:dimethylglycine dehydrogenase
VREAVGLIEISTFAKYEVTGPNAEGWLSRVLANRMPRQGRMLLSPMLNHAGRLIGDFTVAKASPERFYIFGSGIAEEYHLRWFEAHLPGSGISLRSLAAEWSGVSIAGPNARELLSRITAEDVSRQAFPFLAFREMCAGGVRAKVARITFTGDLGFEIWVRTDFQRTLYDAVVEAGADLGLRHFGARALNSLRLEKSFGTWAREFRPIYGPFEARLDRFVDLEKNDFIGRDGAMKERDEGPKRRLVTLVVDDDGVDVMGDEPVWRNGEVIGWVTSGGYAHHANKSVALAYVPAVNANVTEAGAFEVEILGNRRPATLAPAPLFDPAGARMRG